MGFKQGLIICLCPIPNFIILFYYLLSVKILVETENLEICQNIYDYNIISLLFCIFTNCYLVSQLCYERPRIFFNALDIHFVVQIIWYSLLSILTVLGFIFLIDNKECMDDYLNIYNLGIANLILQILMWLLASGLIIYYTQINNKINPDNEENQNTLLFMIEQTV